MADEFEGTDFARWISYGRKRGWVTRFRRIVEPYDDEYDEGVMPSDWKPEASLAGRGPKAYTRSDQSIEDELYKRLSHHPDLDAGDVQFEVKDGVITLSGFADNKFELRLAEEIAQDVLGAKEVHNELRLKEFGFKAHTKSDAG